jgi:NitT/TauT family transport system substrate-binding protein
MVTLRYRGTRLLNSRARLEAIRRIATLTFAVVLVMITLPGAGTAAVGLTSLRVSTGLTDDATVLFYAMQSGMFKKAGLDVQFTVGQSGAAVASAVIAGSIDIGKSSLLNLMNAHVHGIPIQLVAAGAIFDARVAPFGQLLVAADSGITSGKDLTGKIIGVPYLQDFNVLVVRMWMDQNGGDSKTLKFVELPDSALTAALLAHRIDGCVLQEPNLSAAMQTHQVKAFAVTPSDPAFLFSAWFANADWIAAHVQTVATFVRVMSASAAYTNAHPEATVKMMADATGVPLEALQKTPRLHSATSLSTSYIDVAARYGLIPQPFPAQAMMYFPAPH